MDRWDVRVEAHEVVGPNLRYAVAARELTLGARDAADARKEALRLAHIEAEVPPWRPYHRQSWPYISATPHLSTAEEDRLERSRRSR